MSLTLIHQNSTKLKNPSKHSHYGFQEFFQFDSDKGTIVDWNDCQNILTTEDFIIGLVEGLEEEVGSASAATMYSIGCEWGQKDAFFFEKWFEKEFGRPVRQTGLMFLLETWWWPYAAQGWGRWDVDMGDRRQGFMFINLFDSAVARTLGDVGKPVCYIYAGLFAGFFTEMVKKQLSCIEIQCYSMGETYCKFLLGGQERIDAANFWMNEGATAKDIEKRLRAGRTAMMTVPSLNGKGQETPWQTQSVRQFLNQVNWDNLPPTALSPTSSGTAPSFDAQAPLSLSLSVGQFFAAVNWDAVEMTAPSPEPIVADSPSENAGPEVFTLTDFSDLF